MATRTSTRRQHTANRNRTPRRRHFASAFAEHWLLAFAAHVTAALLFALMTHLLHVSCG